MTVTCILITATECEELTVMNGAINYTSLLQLGSIATYTCNEGYTPDNTNALQICTVNGWSGSNFTCTGKTFMPLLH